MARARSKASSKASTPAASDGVQADATFTCPECGKTFTRAASLGAHRRRSHGVAGAGSSSRSAVATRARRRPTRSSSNTNRARSATANRSRGGDGAGTTVDRDALLQALFPNGVPPRESVIRAVNSWLDQAEQLAKMK